MFRLFTFMMTALLVGMPAYAQDKTEEIDKIFGRTTLQGLTCVPLAVFLKKNRIKLEIALARGRKLYDKRQEKKKRQVQREIEEAVGAEVVEEAAMEEAVEDSMEDLFDDF